MPRPKTKSELLEAAQVQFDKVMEKSTENFELHPDIVHAGKEAHWPRDKNWRDILIHLYEWHQLLLKWLENNLDKNEAKPFLPEPYNWKTYPKMNQGFWEKHQKTDFATALEQLKGSHQAALERIKALSEEELFEKKHFSWTGTTNVASYCISSTSSHYDWALKKERVHQRLSKGK